jgi:hypothetical protein
MSRLKEWLRRWRQRDDLYLFKRRPSETIDPIEELFEVVAQSQERDAFDERRLYPANVASYSRRPVARR